MSRNLLSAAFVIGALRVNTSLILESFRAGFNCVQVNSDDNTCDSLPPSNLSSWDLYNT